MCFFLVPCYFVCAVFTVLTRNLDEVFEYFPESQEVGYGFSIDVNDVFYSVPQLELLKAVNQCTDESGEAAFVSKQGLQ